MQKVFFLKILIELQLPNKVFSKDIELENRRIGLPEVIDLVSSFPWKAEKAEIIVKSKRKLLLLLQNIDWSCFWSGGRNVASSPRLWLDISLPSTKHLWTWGDMHSGENTKECKTKIQKKEKIQSLQPNTCMGKPAAGCKNQNVLRNGQVKYAAKMNTTAGWFFKAQIYCYIFQ